MDDWKKILEAREAQAEQLKKANSKERIISQRVYEASRGLDWIWSGRVHVPAGRVAALNFFDHLYDLRDVWGDGELKKVREVVQHKGKQISPGADRFHRMESEIDIYSLVYGWSLASEHNGTENRIVGSSKVEVYRDHGGPQKPISIPSPKVDILSIGPGYRRKYALSSDKDYQRKSREGLSEELPLNEENFKYVLALDCKFRSEAGILKIKKV